MRRKAQTSLESAIAFLIFLSFFLGAMGIWAWSDRQIAKRQYAFNNKTILMQSDDESGMYNNRVVAGQPVKAQYVNDQDLRGRVDDSVQNSPTRTTTKPLIWPIYTREELTASDVHF